MQSTICNEFSLKTPKFRENISWERLDGGEYFIRNSDSGNPLIVSEYVINFLKLATGDNTIKQICEKTGLQVNKSNISKIHELFYTTLYPTGILQNEEIELKKKKSYIKLSFTIIPELTVILISKNLAFLFQKQIAFIFLSFCFIICLAGSIYIWQAGLTISDITCRKPSVIIILLITVFILHELGHSTALYYCGENPQKIGIGIYLFTPVFFADVNNSWKLNNKQRVIVDSGGLYFQFIANCIYILVFLITADNNFLIAALFSITVAIFNLNPFIKMDGYWLLSDFLNIPNLKLKARQKTLLFIHGLISKKLFFKFKDLGFILYYLISTLFTIAFVSYMLFWNFELFINIPSNTKTIFIAIYEGHFYRLNIVLIESVILPFIIAFLLLKMIVGILNKRIS